MIELNQNQLRIIRANVLVRRVLQLNLAPIALQYIRVTWGWRLQNVIGRNKWVSAVRQASQALVIRQSLSTFVQLSCGRCQNIDQPRCGGLVVAINNRIQ